MKKVKIEIFGGVLTILECPKGVNLEVTEHDDKSSFEAVGLEDDGTFKIVKRVVKK